jgi:Lrp/AsnC family transcriptional regulator, leucine-responsive regulatory protein
MLFYKKMGLTDKKMVVLLDENPRLSQSRLAKKLHVSQQVVSYKLSHLLETGIIIKLCAIIDTMKLGFEEYHLFFRLSKFIEIEREFFDFLSGRDNILWAAKIGAYYDVMVQVMVRNYIALERFIEHLQKVFPGVFGDYFILRVNEHIMYNHVVFSDKHSIKKIMSYGVPEETVSLNHLDLQIVLNLKDNCRLSSLSIANKIGVSYKTVRNRVKKLEQDKIIVGYRLFHHMAEYMPYLVLIEFGFYSAEMEKKLIAEIYNTPNFTQYWKVFGKYALNLHARCRDYEELHDLFAKLRERHPIIRGYILIPVFKDIILDFFPINHESQAFLEKAKKESNLNH